MPYLAISEKLAFFDDPVAFSHTPLSEPKSKASGLSRRRKAKAQEHLAFFLHQSGVIPFLLQHGSNLIVIQLVFVSDEASPNPNHGPRSTVAKTFFSAFIRDRVIPGLVKLFLSNTFFVIGILIRDKYLYILLLFHASLSLKLSLEVIKH